MATHSPIGAALPATKMADVLRGLGGPAARSAAADGLNLAEAAGLRADVFITADIRVLDEFAGTCRLPGMDGATLTTVGFRFKQQ